MHRFMTGLAIAFISLPIFSNTAPEQIKFNENDRVSLSLSPLSYNKIYIEGEKITEFDYVEGDFLISDVDEDGEFIPRDDGAIYIIPQTDKTPVIYITTNKGHHASIEARLNEASGKTVSLKYQAKRTTIVKKEPVKKTAAEQVVKQIVEGKIPQGFSGGFVKTKPFHFDSNISMKLVRSYKGQGLNARVFQAINTSKKELALSPELFLDDTTKAVVLSQSKLSPSQSMYVYSVIKERAHA